MRLLKVLIPWIQIRRYVPNIMYSFHSLICDQPVTLISFSDDVSEQIAHIVFHFQCRDAKHEVKPLDETKTLDPIMEPSIFDTLIAQLMNKLGEELIAFDYALATVSSKPHPEALYLTPKQVTFVTYTASNDADSCLSLYIQTKESGYSPGVALPSFQLSGKPSIPIPSDPNIDASVIISYNLFAKKFLVAKLKEAEVGGEKVFSSVELNRFDKKILLDIVLPDTFDASFCSVMTSVYSVSRSQIHWDLKNFPIKLDIDEGQAQWSFSFKPTVRSLYLPAIMMGPGSMFELFDNLSADLTISLTLDKKSSILASDQDGVTASFTLASEDFVKGGTTSDQRFTSVIEDLKKQIKPPSFSASLRLDHVGTTNVFAPGWHTINFDGKIHTPCDIILFGKVEKGAPITNGHSAQVKENLRRRRKEWQRIHMLLDSQGRGRRAAAVLQGR